MTVEAELQRIVRDGGLLAGRRPVVAMISGGRDSTCLLDVLVEMLGGELVGALHVNYSLRDAAALDERWCAQLCEQLSVPLTVLGGEAVGEPPQSGNLQAWARDVRYRAAERLAGERGALIATGHTASDQLETILYRLAASPGRRALLGMSAQEGSVIRPLLAVSREQTAAYCTARGLRWREDESNEDRRFARARVRAEVVPALMDVHPAARSNVLRTAALLREETELLDQLVDAELGGQRSIAVERLAGMAPALARLVVIRLAEQAAGTYVPQAGSRVREIIELASRGGRSELHVGGRAGAVVQGGRLKMVLLAPRTQGVPPGED